MKGLVSNLILILFLISSCKKDQTDYRDKYLGEYYFAIEYIHNTPEGHFPSDWNIVTIDTSYSYSGYIAKSDAYKNKIIVDWGYDTIININDVAYTQKSNYTIDLKGNLSMPEFYY